MVIKTETGWKCPVCEKIYSNRLKATACNQSHDVVYVPILRGDLFRLLQFVYTGDRSLLGETLIKTLMKYSSYSSS